MHSYAQNVESSLRPEIQVLCEPAQPSARALRCQALEVRPPWVLLSLRRPEQPDRSHPEAHPDYAPQLPRRRLRQEVLPAQRHDPTWKGKGAQGHYRGDIPQNGQANGPPEKAREMHQQHQFYRFRKSRLRSNKSLNKVGHRAKVLAANSKRIYCQVQN